MGDSDGAFVVGDGLGPSDGLPEGETLGAVVGPAVGLAEGDAVGGTVGNSVELETEGDSDGAAVGPFVSFGIGCLVEGFLFVGRLVILVGRRVGLLDDGDGVVGASKNK